MDLIGKMLTLHEALAQPELPHAFGGALALAWCTGEPRATIDIDLNIFVGDQDMSAALACLPEQIEVSEEDRERLARDLQHRLWWDNTPVDVFFNSTDYHDEVAQRIRWQDFAGATLPFLSCLDLAVFKVFFDRTKDWADLEAMYEAGTLDAPRVSGIIAAYLGIDDPRLKRLADLVQSASS